MIATGGLLRYNARRQDSLRSKPRPKPKKSRKKRRQELVVVRGRIQLCSVSGLVAVLGLVVLLVGGVLAAVGYCPQELLFQERPEEGATNSSAPAQLKLNGFNSSQNISLNLLQKLLHRFLDSDRLKVLGPLVMGVGIFLFLCANAVLHENRDRKTKVIKLQDIYSTVIDLHQQQQRDRDRDRDQGRDQGRDRTMDWTMDQAEVQSRDQSPVQTRTRTRTRTDGSSQSPASTPLSLRFRDDFPDEPRENGGFTAERGEGGAYEGVEGGAYEAVEGGACSRWWRKAGGSVRERPAGGVFSVFHERRFSLPRGFSFQRPTNQSERRQRPTNQSERRHRPTNQSERRHRPTNQSAASEQRLAADRQMTAANQPWQEAESEETLDTSANQPWQEAESEETLDTSANQPWREAESEETLDTSANQPWREAESEETLDTSLSLSLIGSRSLSLSLIGSQRPLLMTSCSSSLSPAPCTPSTNRRSSWI